MRAVFILILTAESQSTQRINSLFCFPLSLAIEKRDASKGGKQNPKTLRVPKFETMTKIPVNVSPMSREAEGISFAVLSTAKEKYNFLCDLCGSSEAGGEFPLC